MFDHDVIINPADIIAPDEELSDTIHSDEDEDALLSSSCPISIMDTDSLPFPPKRRMTRKSKPFQPIILCFVLLLLFSFIPLAAQINTSVKLGMTYTDNVFQFSEYDLSRFEAGNPELDFAKASDDVEMAANLSGSYDLHYRWWLIQPQLTAVLSKNILNPDKQGIDILGSIRFSRRLADLSFGYGFYPINYVRNYIDTDGTGKSEKYDYQKDQYRADITLRPYQSGSYKLGFKYDDYAYNEYFTEFDGTTTTWSAGYRHSFPIMYLSAGYDYKAYVTDQSKDADPIDDASYESNVYSFGMLIKKMPLDNRYPSITWRPDLNLSFEQRYYSGGDDLHRNRTDIINNTDASFMFYYGENWNFNLDYSHTFRNVDADDSVARKYKEYSENRFGISVEYSF